jgi:hypothetical protein
MASDACPLCGRPVAVGLSDHYLNEHSELFAEVGRSPEDAIPPEHPCDCWRLTRPLDEGEALPDHACPETMHASVALWAREGWEETERLVDRALAARPLDPAFVDAFNKAYRLVVLPATAQWPFPLGGRLLGLVIRQWAHEEPNETLANQLAEDPTWQRAVVDLRSLYATWCGQAADRPDHGLDDWLGKAGWSWSPRGRSGDDPDAEGSLAARLRGWRLPSTPATMRHLRAVVVGEREPLPARGLLVTTRLYLTEDVLETTRGDILVPDANPEVSIDGALEFATGPLLDRAKEIALAHRNWGRRIRQHPFTTMAAVRKAQRGTFRPGEQAEDRFDYLAEALRADGVENLQALIGCSRRNRDGLIAEYLKKVYDRVRARRVAAGLDPTPPPGWIEEARRRLSLLLA